MNNVANVAEHRSSEPKVNGQQNLTGLVEFFFYQYLMDHGWHASYQCSVLWKGTFDLD